MVLVLKKEVVKTNNVEHEDTGKYRQLLVRTLHQCSIKFPDIASTIIPVVSMKSSLTLGLVVQFLESLKSCNQCCAESEAFWDSRDFTVDVP